MFFLTKYVIPKSLKVSHWLSKTSFSARLQMTNLKDTLQEFVSFEDLELLEKNFLQFPCFT